MTATLPATSLPLTTALDDLALTQAIGNTPLLRLHGLERRHDVAGNVELWLKAEWANPGGSVKDRPALAIVRDALARGELGGGQTLLDGTSGNMGISYALLGAALGFPVELVLPFNASEERRQLLTALGATFTLSDEALGADGVLALVHELHDANPGRYYFAEQSANPANPRAHYETTGPEIWRQTDGRLTHFVCGLGTTGTMMGAGRFFREQSPAIELVAAEAATYPHDIPGVKHMGSGPIPDIYDAALIDRHILIESAEAATATRSLATVEGLLAGTSTGAAVAAAVQVAREVAGPAVIVLIAPDNAGKYLSTNVWAATGDAA
ncbi:MAG: cysteine synthase family protein [Thermomicrobiales bacterium]